MTPLHDRAAYLALLMLPHGGALRAKPEIQAAMATIRDHIAELEGREPEDVQNEYERLPSLAQSFLPATQ